MKTFFTLDIFNIKANEAEEISALLFDLGATGVQENLEFVQHGSHYEAQIIDKQETSLRAYFDTNPDIKKLLLLYPELNFSIGEEVNKDWLQEWKKGFKSFELVDGIWIVPSWLDAPLAAAKVIRMDPGMAFGTGTHETTKLMSQMLYRWKKGSSLLDVGTGTAVLAILGSHLGFNHIIGTEIDADARRTARENVELNAVQISIPEAQVEQLTERFDMVIANIIDGVLVEIQSALLDRLNPKGRIIVSGILAEREITFLENFNKNNKMKDYRLLERRSLGEWLSFAWEKN